MNDHEQYEIVYRSHNPVEAEMMEDVLGQEGYEPHLIGTRSAALLGATDAIFALRIEVPERFAGDARALVEEILEPTVFGEDADVIAQADDESDESDEREDAEEPNDAPTPRLLDEDTAKSKASKGRMGNKNRVIAAGIVFVFPGAGHYYAGRVVTGCFITTIMVIAFGVLFTDELPIAGTTLLLGSLLLDIIGSQVAIAKHNAKGKITKGKQLLLGFAYFLGLAGLSAILQAVVPEPDRSGPWEYQTIDWNQVPLPSNDLRIPVELNLELDTDTSAISEDDIEEMMRLLHRREIDGLLSPTNSGEGNPD